MKRKVEPGDWICWQHVGGPVIAEVLYVHDLDHYPYRVELVTSKGTCRPDDVLEYRTREGIVWRRGQPEQV